MPTLRRPRCRDRRQDSLPARAGSPLAGQDSHLLDGKNEVSWTHRIPPFPFDQQGLVASISPIPTRLAVSLGRAGQFETLESVSVLYRSYEGRAWSPLEVDLSEYGGERVTLRLEAIPDAPLEPGTLAWWGSPRIALEPDADDQWSCPQL